ncbi:MAG: group II intron reverse transcriptase domain-containing protein [Anaerolineales bacterium]|nr:group II intron reverse transcriptase domain-containing protein [Anaerolineales bacterium]
MVLQEQLTTWQNLTLAYQNASRGKRGNAPAAEFEILLADHLLELQKELEEKTYQPGKYHSFYIHKPKKRLISAAPFRDRVVHHALCNITTPYFEKRFIPTSYANRVSKGTHRALDECQRLARRYKYVLQCDVRQFFPSIDHTLLMESLQRMLPDDSALWLIERILESGVGVLSEEYSMAYFAGDDLFSVHRPRGLPIGNLTSQWWANCYLNQLDQFVKRELACKAYLRYVDDFLLFADDKQALWNWRKEIIERLTLLRLTIHEERAVPRPVTDGIKFLGFVHYPEKRLLKREKGIAYQRKLKRLLKTASDETLKASVQGWVNHLRYGDTWGLRRAILRKSNLLGEVYV